VYWHRSEESSHDSCKDRYKCQFIPILTRCNNASDAFLSQAWCASTSSLTWRPSTGKGRHGTDFCVYAVCPWPCHPCPWLHHCSLRSLLASLHPTHPLKKLLEASQIPIRTMEGGPYGGHPCPPRLRHRCRPPSYLSQNSNENTASPTTNRSTVIMLRCESLSRSPCPTSE